MRIFFLALIYVAILGGVSAQVPSTIPYKDGEILNFKVSYFMKSLWTDLAGLEMKVIDVPGKSKPINRLEFNASTFSSWDSYVKIRHSYQTWVDQASVKPLIMKQNSDVKGHTKDAKYSFKFKSGIAAIDVSSSDGAPLKKDLTIYANTYDIVSLLYYLRTLDFEKISPGKSFPVTVLFLERVLKIKVKYLGKETISIEKQGKKSCYKLAMELENNFVVKKDANFLWLTADNNRTPAQISAIFKEGQVLVKLTDAKGLKN
ncbi:MAG: DUF3108 domain-containing protein [Salinivirgaceae bacterium]